MNFSDISAFISEYPAKAEKQRKHLNSDYTLLVSSKILNKYNIIMIFRKKSETYQRKISLYEKL